MERHAGGDVAIIHADLDKEAPALIGAVVGVDAVIICLPGPGQADAVLEYPVELHDGERRTV
jgi:hypothetical protein